MRSSKRPADRAGCYREGGSSVYLLSIFVGIAVCLAVLALAHMRHPEPGGDAGRYHVEASRDGGR